MVYSQRKELITLRKQKFDSTGHHETVTSCEGNAILTKRTTYFTDAYPEVKNNRYYILFKSQSHLKA